MTLDPKDSRGISSTSPVEDARREKKVMLGSFSLSLLVHASILLIIGGIIIAPGAVQKFMPVASVPTAPVDIPPPPKMEEAAPVDQSLDSGGSPISDQPQDAVTPQDSAKPESLVLDTPSSMGPRMDTSLGASTTVASDVFKQGGRSGSGSETGSGVGHGLGRMTLFGSTEKSPSALVGRFFDLKQTPQGKPTSFATENMNDWDPYFAVQERFIHDGWNEEILNKYFQAPKPLYATQFWLSRILSEEAPKAFGVEKECKGGFWLAHYKGRVVPPKDGTYRFVGYADHEIIVAVNKKLVLVSSWTKDRPQHLSLPESECPLTGAYNDGQGGLRAGPWFHLTTSEPVDLDILWGDNGGHCSCFLMVEEKGAKYEMENGHPILPVFQLAPQETPLSPGAPKFATGFPVWKVAK